MLEQLFLQLDPKKSPGAPYCYRFPTNAALLSQAKASFADLVQERHRLLFYLGASLSERLNEEGPVRDLLFFPKEGVLDNLVHRLISVNLVKLGFADPVLLKKKSEPRLRGKRPRLVNMVSAVTNTLYRLALGDALLEEQLHDDLPTAVALDLTSEHETEKMYLKFKSRGLLRTDDVQGWEYANRSDLHWRPFLRWCRTLGLCSTSIDHVTDNRFYLLLALYFCDLHKVQQTEDGILLVGPAGIVCSGILTTYSDNSIKRGSLSAEVADIQKKPFKDLFIQVAGDDCVDNNDSAPEYYLRRGFVTTDERFSDVDYEFCSTLFTKTGAYQVNIQKFFVNALYSRSTHDHALETMLAFNSSFKRHPEYEKYLSLMKLEGIHPESVPLGEI